MIMTIMSPSSHHRTSLHAVIFMFGDVHLPVTLIVDLSLASVVQHSPFQFHALAYAVQCPSCRSSDRVQCAWRVTTITLRVQNLTLSSLKWSPHKHTCKCVYIYIYIHTYKNAPYLPYIRGSLRLAPNYCFLWLLWPVFRLWDSIWCAIYK